MVYQFPHVGHFRSLHGTRASSAPLISCLIFLIYTRCTNKNHATASVLRWSTVLSAEWCPLCSRWNLFTVSQHFFYSEFIILCAKRNEEFDVIYGCVIFRWTPCTVNCNYALLKSVYISRYIIVWRQSTGSTENTGCSYYSVDWKMLLEAALALRLSFEWELCSTEQLISDFKQYMQQLWRTLCHFNSRGQIFIKPDYRMDFPFFFYASV